MIWHHHKLPWSKALTIRKYSWSGSNGASENGQNRIAGCVAGQTRAVWRKFAQHKVPLLLLLWEENHCDVICLTKVWFGTQYHADNLPRTEDFSVSGIPLFHPYESWSGICLQLAGRSHCFCTFVSLQKNFQVKELDLSHNEFSEKGGHLLGEMLGNLLLLEYRHWGTCWCQHREHVFLSPENMPHNMWEVQKAGCLDLGLPACSRVSPSSPQVTRATRTNISEHKCRMQKY